MKEPPKKGELVKLDQIRIDRNMGKVCRCTGERKVVLNPKNDTVYCSECGALLDPFRALWDMASYFDEKNEKMERWKNQAESLRNYKPWLKVIRHLESNYRGRKYLPCCPRCEEPFYLEEIDQWHPREFADKRIRDWREDNG